MTRGTDRPGGDHPRLPRRLAAEPPRVDKVALVLMAPDRSRARFAGLSVNQRYLAEDTARCRRERCPVGQEHEAPHVAGTCGFHGTTDDPLSWMLPEAALLDVELYGRIIRHERGWRASGQRVLGARFVRGCMSCHEVDPEAVLVSVPAPIADDALMVGPRCRRCTAVWRWPDRGEPIAVAQLAGLLGTEVTWADLATSEEVLRRAVGRRAPGMVA